MNEGLDTGDILLEEKIKIDNNDNLNTLSEKLSILSAKLLLNATSCLLYTSPSPRDRTRSRMPSSA